MLQRVCGLHPCVVQEVGQEGDSLDAQLDQIQAYASANGARLVRVFEDAASAFNSGSSDRPGLRDSINEALRIGVPLLVIAIGRLLRSLMDLTLLDQKGLSIHSAGRGKVSKATLKGHIARAEAESAARAAKATQQHGSSPRKQNRPSAASSAARMKGTISNILLKEKRTRDVADFITTTPGAAQMTRQQLVDTLNNAGVLNLRSVRGGVRKPWTKEALRPVQRAAQDLIAGEAEMGRDEMMLEKERLKRDRRPTEEAALERAEKSTALPALRPNTLEDCLSRR